MTSPSGPMTYTVESVAVAVDHQQNHGGSTFPLVLSGAFLDDRVDDALAWVKHYRDDLLELSTKHGAILFRNFPMASVEAFDAFIQALGVANFPYRESLSNAVRVNRTERVFSANEAPPEVRIHFHHEMAQTPMFPARILFYCEIAAGEGGATPLCRSDIVYERLKQRCPAFIDACETKGLTYTNVMPGVDDPKSGMGRSWQSTLRAETRQEAEDRLRELNYSWEWTDEDCLKATTPILPAVREISPGRKTFFNQLIAAYCGWKDERNDPSKAIRHGDGSELDRDAVMHSVEIAEELTFNVPWQPGDVALLDNTVVMHARQPFKGTRKIVASLAEKRTQSFTSTR